MVPEYEFTLDNIGDCPGCGGRIGKRRVFTGEHRGVDTYRTQLCCLGECKRDLVLATMPVVLFADDVDRAFMEAKA